MDESTFLNNLHPLVATTTSEVEVRLSKDDLKTLLAIATKYRTLHHIGKLVASEMETDALLRLAMDKVIEVTRAQRGFIALIEKKNKLDFKVARHLEKKYKPNEKQPRLSKAAEQLLLDYNYPDNIRELENIIERAVIFCKDNVIEAHHLPEELQAPILYGYTKNEGPATFQERKQRVIEKFERDELSRILTQTSGKVRESARIAGMDVKNFSEKLQRYAIKADDYRGQK